MNEDQAVAFCRDISRPSIIICLEIPDKCAITRLTIRGNFDDGRSSIDKRLKNSCLYRNLGFLKNLHKMGFLEVLGQGPYLKSISMSSFELFELLSHC